MSREKDQEQKRENIREQADSQGTDTKQSPLTEEVLKKQVHSEERSLPEPEHQAEDPTRGEDLKPQEKKNEQDAA